MTTGDLDARIAALRAEMGSKDGVGGDHNIYICTATGNNYQAGSRWFPYAHDAFFTGIGEEGRRPNVVEGSCLRVGARFSYLGREWRVAINAGEDGKRNVHGTTVCSVLVLVAEQPHQIDPAFVLPQVNESSALPLKLTSTEMQLLTLAWDMYQAGWEGPFSAANARLFISKLPTMEALLKKLISGGLTIGGRYMIPKLTKNVPDDELNEFASLSAEVELQAQISAAAREVHAWRGLRELDTPLLLRLAFTLAIRRVAFDAARDLEQLHRGGHEYELERYGPTIDAFLSFLEKHKIPLELEA